MPPRACAACWSACRTRSEYEYPTDTGQVIKVKITVDRAKREATVDFTGTSPVMKNNFNAPEPVARAAVLYAFRVMVEDMIPMNAGCLRPINIIIPDGCMLRPAYPAAVVAGNVETSQHVTNAMFGAMGALANAQGTMNNLTFGNENYQYYETICSGSPAGRMNNGRGFAGTSGVHTHMTNSRLTDPEMLEMRFPVLLEDFHIREGSGGKGKWHAGDGTGAPSASSKRWNAPSCRRTATARPKGWTAAAIGRGRQDRGAPRGRHASRRCAPATRPCWRPARRSSSPRRRRAGSERPRALLYSRSVWIQRGDMWISSVCRRPGPRLTKRCGRPAGPSTVSPASASITWSPTKKRARPCWTTKTSS